MPEDESEMSTLVISCYTGKQYTGTGAELSTLLEQARLDDEKAAEEALQADVQKKLADGDVLIAESLPELVPAEEE